MCTFAHPAHPDIHSSYSPKLVAAVLFKHVRANNHGFERIYTISLPLPFFADTDECIEGEGCMVQEDAVRAKETFRITLGLDTEMWCGAKQKLFFGTLFNGVQYLVDVFWILQPCIVHLLQIVGARSI